ncbi:hypothetical protein [Brevundimonas sp.]|jgi:hypothetical protein|uniref:hypothetical protein n=1 Tax=Brevundimonas sp. TaxID=1871086 RepID=UPI0026310B6F|nr:hypothetical protein [Brevundimonas sp.]
MTAPDSKPQQGPPEDRRGLHDLADDAMGFGMAEVRTAWAMLVRPARSLDAYMRLGPTAGGTLARPLRLYLALNAIMMLMMFLLGGMEIMLDAVPPEGWEAGARQAGKSVDEYRADAEGWVSLTMVPLSSALYALMLAPFMRWWDPEDLGWRKGFRSTFVLLNALTVPFMPLTFFLYDPRLYLLSPVVLFALIGYAFLRTGWGRWFSNPLEGAFKAAILILIMVVTQFVVTIPLMAIGYLGGRFGA